MTMARAHLVDVSVTRWYHCITAVSVARSCSAKDRENRKEWIEHRLQELAEIFAVSVGGFSVMDNHLHVLVRLDPDIADRLVRRRSRAALGTALPAPRQIPPAVAGLQSLGRMAPARRPVGGDGTRSDCKA